MGCGGSKEAEDANKIKYEMKETKIPDFDSFFNKASDTLKELEELRAAFQDSRESMREISRIDELKDPKLIEAFRIFFWSVSAHKDGKIADAGFDIELNPPTVTVKTDGMDHNTHEFNKQVKELMGGVRDGPGKIVTIVENLKEMNEKAQELAKTAADKAKEAGLSALDAAKAAGNTGTNVKTLGNGLAKAKDVQQQITQGAEDIKALLPKLKEMKNTTDETGKKAADDKALKMTEIFDKYHTGEKKTKEEIEAEKKKNKKGKK